ncbi:hypothetical protein K9U33_16245 [Rhodoblastus acidophilus]|uniref:DUF4279 domain-containing protein n=1 Tax=Candidatus Rhodoblastus alkanivorans TaxID=2954117 RepID=A0ABS9Z918_9HYPH|nr:hypothetical protein [Candidatus Rhodoblastus alkanivorans]MCI4680186.1 hypothetical protein [Candidatus Rhodoblastus alkanivorans]MCI4684143.1 hypothetical protein [Candidatus Rhodoblastus alkanivorans]
MAETKVKSVGNHEPPTFKTSLRLWSDHEPLKPVVHASKLQWKHFYVKGQTIPAQGRAPARIASRNYACSEDVEYDNIEHIAPGLAQWLDEIECRAPSITALAKAGKIEPLLWVAIFGRDQVATPVLPAELDARAKQAGFKILIENYTVMDEETGNPAKRFFGAKG